MTLQPPSTDQTVVTTLGNTTQYLGRSTECI